MFGMIDRVLEKTKLGCAKSVIDTTMLADTASSGIASVLQNGLQTSHSFPLRLAEGGWQRWWSR